MADFQAAPTYADVILIDDKGKAKFNPIWLNWFLAVVQLLNDAGGGSGTFTHNDMAGLQGGTSNQYYHLSAARFTFVGAITASAAQINQLGSGLSGTITTAKLTGGGANGSMTFTNGVLTGSVPAT